MSGSRSDTMTGHLDRPERDELEVLDHEQQMETATDNLIRTVFQVASTIINSLNIPRDFIMKIRACTYLAAWARPTAHGC